MNDIFVFTGRNLKVFVRDKTNVFFSLLSPLILIILYVLFLGNLQVENLEEKIPQAPDGSVYAFVSSWVFAGIIMITSVTSGLGAMSVYVDDYSSGRFKDFLVSPLKRIQVALGYICAAVIISVTLTTVTLVISQLYMMILGQGMMDLSQWFVIFGYVLLSCTGFSCLAAFIVTFVKTPGAFSALSTIVGTSVGFLAAAYIPNGTLPVGVVNVLNALPFSQAAMLFRNPVTDNSLSEVVSELQQGKDTALEQVEEFYGVTLFIGDWQVPVWFAIVELIILIIVFSVLAAWRMDKKIR